MTPNDKVSSDDTVVQFEGADETLKVLETTSWTDKCSPSWRLEVSRQSQSLLLITSIAESLRLHYAGADTERAVWLPDPRRIPFFQINPSTMTDKTVQTQQEVEISEKRKGALPLPMLELESDAPCEWSGSTRHLYPYSGPSWSVWFQSRAEETARDMFEGEWVGYCTDDFYMAGGSLQRVPIQGVRFRKVEKHDKGEHNNFDLDQDKMVDGDTVQYSIESVDGAGVDGVGHFRLYGVLTLPQATVRLFKKHYKDESGDGSHGNASGDGDDEHDEDDEDDEDDEEEREEEEFDIPNHKKRFVWDGRVTPLGICGIWEEIESLEAEPYGAFWLWKKEWIGSASR
jgi:hypothetical protein